MWFIAGLFIGAILGTIMMAVFALSRSDDIICPKCGKVIDAGEV